MAERERILKFVKRYRIVYTVLVGVVELIIYNLITPKTPDNYAMLKNLDNTLSGILRVVFLAFWIIVLIFNFSSGFYENKCGRKSLLQDILHFQKSPFYLFFYFINADKHKLKVSRYPKTSWKNVKGLIFGYSEQGNLVYEPSRTEANLAIWGSPGSMKTVSFVKPNARKFGGSVLTVDIKGDIYAYNRNYRKIVRFAPDIPNATKISAHYNPFVGFKRLSSTELKLRVTNMAEILIPNDSEKEPYFSTTARKLFSGILLFLLEQCPDLTFPEFLHAVLHNQKPASCRMDIFPSNVFEWIECVATSPYPAAVEQVTAMLGNNEKNISGVADRLNTALVPFSNEVLDTLLTDNGNCISAKTLYSGSDVYLQISQNNLSIYAPLFTLIMSGFMTEFANRPDSAYSGRKNRPILTILDEFPQLTFPYNTINQFLSTLRSKSVVIMLVCQSVSQLAKKYDNFGYQALLGNCTYQVCCKSNDGLTQDYLKKIIGNKKTLKQSYSAVEDEEPVYQNSDYGALTDKAIVYFNGEHTELIKIKSYE